MIIKTVQKTLTTGEIVDITRNIEGTWDISCKNETFTGAIQGNEALLLRNSYKGIVTSPNSVSAYTYAHLHAHSEFSILDGISKISDLAKYGPYYTAKTDHGNMFGILAFADAMKNVGKHPIIGCEVYMALQEPYDRSHLVLLAENNIGVKNINKIVSQSHENFYRKPRVSMELLKEFSEGIICLSACLGGCIPKAFYKGDSAQAYAFADELVGIFGKNNFFIEIQRHNLEMEEVVNAQLIKLAKTKGLKVAATTDSHYTLLSDKEIHQIALCISTKSTIDFPKMSFKGDAYHIHSSEEMESLWEDMPEVLENTLSIAERCNGVLETGENHMPECPFPEEFSTMTEYFKHLCFEGFKNRFENTPNKTNSEYLERLEYEMSVMVNMDYCAYFVIVADYINFAKNNHIAVGPGRGSAAGSLVAYCLGITDLDPVEHGLIFERFLNPDRISMPDIDTDFQDDRTPEVLEYIRNKYGYKNVSQIVAFQTMAAKAAVKDVARVFDYPASFANSLTKLIPEDPKMTLAKALEQSYDFKTSYDSNEDVKKIVDIAMRLEGNVRSVSQHPCGLIIAPQEVENYAATMITYGSNNEKILVVQLKDSECERAGLIKMDLLSIANLQAVQSSFDAIIKRFGEGAIAKKMGVTHNNSLRYQDIPLTDRATFKMLESGLTKGVFQMESPGMTQVIVNALEGLSDGPEEDLPQGFERLIATVALYRPGPMDSIPEYLSNMKNIQNVHYDHPMLEEILKPTYGIIVYQEQVIKIVQVLGGFSAGRADEVRKAMGKKKMDMMKAASVDFVKGCLANNISEETATVIWDKMAKFAEYAFNRSHAACYAYIAYITAYLACHYPEYFFAGMLNAFSSNNNNLKKYLAEIPKRNISLIPPSVQASEMGFSVDATQNAIVYGLGGIKGLKSLAEVIIEARDTKGNFKDLEDFVRKVSSCGSKALGVGALTALSKSGSLDCFELNRKELEINAGVIASDYKKSKGLIEMGQISLFDTLEIAPTYIHEDEYPLDIFLENEFETLGLYISGHPVNEKVKTLSPDLKSKLIKLEDLTEAHMNYSNLQTVGQINDLVPFYTKNQDLMYKFNLRTQFADIPCVIFPKDAKRLTHPLSNKSVVLITCRYQANEDFGDQLIISEIIDTNYLAKDKQQELIIEITTKEDQEEVLDLCADDGDTIVKLKVVKKDRIYNTGKTVSVTPKLLEALAKFPYKMV